MVLYKRFNSTKMNQLKDDKMNVIKRIITLLRCQEEEIPVVGKDRVLQAIKKKIAADRILRRRRFWIRISYSLSACIALLIGIGWFYYNNNKPDLTLSEITRQMKEGNKALIQGDIVLELSKNESVTLNNEDEVKYAANGTVCVNHKAISRSKNRADVDDENTGYNKLTVPLGKRTQVNLADGTKMWVNSGTYVVYPAVFSQKNREIFVDGEVYLDVAHDSSHPFIVKTDKFSVRVLGTSFNVSAYSSEAKSSVVLVKGSVNVTDQKKEKVNLVPGQITQIQGGDASTPAFTDVERYICWIDNQLIIDDSTMSYVLNKLRLYYGKQFVSTPKVDALITSGKLELKKNFADIMRTITFSLPIRYQEINNIVYLTYNDEKPE